MSGANKRPALAAFLTNALLFGVFFVLASPRFETNDDVQMMLIASGAHTGQPGEFLIFSNVLVGLILKSLYLLWDTVNWYALYLLCVHFASMCALLLGLLRRCRAPLAFLLFGLLFVGFELRFLLLLQFTTTAAVAAVGGTLLLLSLPAEGRRPRGTLLLGVALVLAAAMVRESALYLMGVVLAPVVLHRLTTNGGRRAAEALALAFFLAGVAILFDAQAHANDPGWQRYRAYNEVRSDLHDLMTLDYDARTQPLLEEIDWSANDLAMFAAWFFAEPDVYSLEKLETLRDGLAREQAFGSRFLGMRRLSARLAGTRSYFVIALSSLALAAVLLTRWRDRALIAATLVLAVGAGAYLALIWKLPERVLLPILFAVSASAFFVASRGHVEGAATRARTLLRGVLALLLAIALAQHARLLAHIDTTNHQQLQAFAKILKQLKTGLGADVPRPVFLVWGAALPYESVSPFSVWRDLATLETIPLGWSTHSPTYEATLRRHGIEDIHTALLERDALHLVVAPGTLELYQRFMQEHYARDVSFRVKRIEVPYRASWGRVSGVNVVKPVE
jgi:hypothetical protein